MKTVQIQFQPKTIALYLASLFLFIGIMEVVLRIESISSRLAAPSFGSEQHQFEIQLARLKAVHEKQGAIDCIFVGDSLVWLDLDPLKFGEGYRDHSGKDIKCFNFGIAALPASGVSVLTKILVEEYHPQLIIYGLHANSVVVGQDNRDTKIILDTPWVKYKSGNLNLVGWFYENSYFVRYVKVLNQLMRFDREAVTNELGTLPQQLLGFDSKNGQRIDISIPPLRSNAADLNGFEKYYKYQVFPENISGILEIAELADTDTKVFMVMMPVNKSFYAFFENGSQDYYKITEIIQTTLLDTQTVFLKTEGQILLPDANWWDYSHLNSVGAGKFSYWLGGEVGVELFDD